MIQVIIFINLLEASQMFPVGTRMLFDWNGITAEGHLIEHHESDPTVAFIPPKDLRKVSKGDNGEDVITLKDPKLEEKLLRPALHIWTHERLARPCEEISDKMYQLGLALLKQARCEKSAKAFHKCLQMNPSHIFAADFLFQHLRRKERAFWKVQVDRFANNYEPEVKRAFVKTLRHAGFRGKYLDLESRLSQCLECGKEVAEDVKLSKCGRCKFASYCGKECQTRNYAEHRDLCKNISKDRTSLESIIKVFQEVGGKRSSDTPVPLDHICFDSKEMFTLKPGKEIWIREVEVNCNSEELQSEDVVDDRQ